MRLRAHTCLFLLTIWHQLTHHVAGDIFTSIAAVKRMLRNEKNLLTELRNNLPDEMKQQDFLNFYQRNLKATASRNWSEELERLEHANGAYLVIKDFSRSYGAFKKLFDDLQIPKRRWKQLASVAGSQDVHGSLLALIGLQDVYDLQTRDMIAGKFRQYTGPALSPEDVFLMGDAAFKDGHYRQSVELLEMAITSYSPTFVQNDASGAARNVSLAHIYAMLGRSFLRNGDIARAKYIYSKWITQDPDEEAVKTLGHELNGDFQNTESASIQNIWRHLHHCRVNERQSKPHKTNRPAQRCRYRGRIPYYRYAEEVVSENPYISIIYGLVTEKESRKVKRLSLEKMSRGEVVIPSGTKSSYTRMCQLAFLADNSSSTVHTISHRIGYITGLDTTVSPQGFLSPSQSCSEPLQVVNYGIGGYFGLHRDPFEYRNHVTDRVLTHSGNRIASFLIYLSHVQLGGHTSFPDLNLVLRPVKNSALFWYNYNPSGQLEELTWHQGCPVLVGDKWIANKWILSYGNTFVRRCGLKKEATQADIEEDMLRGYK